MSLTLGQKLRQAREDRGISVGEIAAQTRIAPLYIESIDNDDYRALPGGIFNRGFVKSYAKYVGIDEQEALLDYAKLLNETEGNDVEEVKTYRPQVLTDDRMQSSMLPTLIIAAILLGIMTGGVLFLVRYLRQPSEARSESGAVNAAADATNTNLSIESETPRQPAPETATLKVEFMAVNQPVSLRAIVDDQTSTSDIMPGSARSFEPKQNIRLSYSSSRARFAELTVNGKPIRLPDRPLEPRRSIIEFEINKENLRRILETGAILAENSPADTRSSAGGTAAESRPAAEKAKQSNTVAAPSPKPSVNAPKPTNKPPR